MEPGAHSLDVPELGSRDPRCPPVSASLPASFSLWVSGVRGMCNAHGPREKPVSSRPTSDACDQAALAPVRGAPGLTYRVYPREQQDLSVWTFLLLLCPGQSGGSVTAHAWDLWGTPHSHEDTLQLRPLSLNPSGRAGG